MLELAGYLSGAGILALYAVAWAADAAFKRRKQR